MTKKLKSVNHSTNERQPPRNVFDEYTDCNKMKKVPVNSKIVEDMAKYFVDTIRDNEKIVRMSQVYKYWGILDNDFDRLRAKYPILEAAYKYGLALLGEKREIGALFKKGDLDWAVVNASQAHYCKIAKAQAEWRSFLSKKEDEKPTNVTVVFPEHELKQKEKK